MLGAAALADWVHASHYSFYLPPGINSNLIRTALWLSLASILAFYTALLHTVHHRRYGRRSVALLATVVALSLYVVVDRRASYEPIVAPPAPFARPLAACGAASAGDRHRRRDARRAAAARAPGASPLLRHTLRRGELRPPRELRAGAAARTAGESRLRQAPLPSRPGGPDAARGALARPRRRAAAAAARFLRAGSRPSAGSASPRRAHRPQGADGLGDSRPARPADGGPRRARGAARGIRQRRPGVGGPLSRRDGRHTGTSRELRRAARAAARHGCGGQRAGRRHRGADEAREHPGGRPARQR